MFAKKVCNGILAKGKVNLMKQFINEIRIGKRHINPIIVKTFKVIGIILLADFLLYVVFMGLSPLTILWLVLTH